MKLDKIIVCSAK